MLADMLPLEIQLRSLAAAEMEARLRITSDAARLMSSAKLTWDIAPVWMQRDARKAAQAEKIWARLGRRVSAAVSAQDARVDRCAQKAA